MKTLWIRWQNKESKNYVDIIPFDMFGSDIERRDVNHLIRRPNGNTYPVQCDIQVRKNVAFLIYHDQANAWPGTTRITFTTDERSDVDKIEWQDKGQAKFVDAHVVFSNEDSGTGGTRFFAVKTDVLDRKDNTLVLSARPIESMGGDDISVGDQVFVWVFENAGGHGMEWYGTVRNLDRRHSNAFEIRIESPHRIVTKFGTNEVEQLVSGGPDERGLFRKLKQYSLAGVRRVGRGEADILLSLFPLGLLGKDGQDEVERLIRLGKIASRPNQSAFSATIREVYRNQCAITGCATEEALEAAHIRVAEGIDDNNRNNGILLRADIHALFDAGLIALTPDGRRLEVSPELDDPSYKFLGSVDVYQPLGHSPSKENIRHHRLRFGFPCLD